MKAKLLNLLTRKVIEVHSSTDSPDSSYGIPAWVDDEGNSYGQVPYGPPFGFQMVYFEDDDEEDK